jgi:hypothetical protein
MATLTLFSVVRLFLVLFPFFVSYFQFKTYEEIGLVFKKGVFVALVIALIHATLMMFTMFSLQVSVGGTVMSNAGSIMVGGSVGGLSAVSQQPTAVLQAQASGVQSANTVTSAANTVSTSSLPQMLFLNQVTLNGQTSFVLVDANNKPVQLPQGIQVINLPMQNVGGQQLPVVSVLLFLLLLLLLISVSLVNSVLQFLETLSLSTASRMSADILGCFGKSIA